MKKVGFLLISLIAVLIIFGGYQLQRPILTEQEAASKAKQYLETVNQKLDLSYNINIVEIGALNKDTFWNNVTGNRT
ncbi:hypothetical protein FE782_19120 [Paenibacillus antri]|uniref:Uncharacterized protein n=1 Tax=Paenibacillus antri TaxID=2582848 RepID=A0A5R9G377_9BACL|nr:hypothetical protein [Paenibacillus antri]TLS50807.1 hypothetical protein FE782_19120 [Paenibacillus antri]